MSTLELKRDLKKKIDLLSVNRFKKVYGKIVNTMNSELNEGEWLSLSQGEKEAIEKGLLQAHKGNVHKHEAVMAEFFKKYGDKSTK